MRSWTSWATICKPSWPRAVWSTLASSGGGPAGLVRANRPASQKSTHLHADETGWRVNGQAQWLWCFANHQVCYYMVDRSLRTESPRR
ncbi:MAG: transposase [bacterium]|nr:transposase [bacterium]